MGELTGDSGTPLQALQQALAAEHAATWLLGFLGARVSTVSEPVLAARLAEAFVAHRAARDELTARISRRGAQPVASEVDYAVPGRASTPGQVRVVALTVEERVTRTYAEVVAGTAEDDRRWAVAALQAGAVRSLGFGAAPSDLPGLS